MPYMKPTTRPQSQPGRMPIGPDRERSSAIESRHDNELTSDPGQSLPLDWGHYIESRLHDFQRR